MELPDDDQCQFAKLYRKRVANNQDLSIIISDSENRRGTGKTVLSLRLAEALDRTDEGLTKEKVALGVDDLLDAYMEQPKGSALVLDEAEASLSKYEAASAVNKAMRELVSMGRIREKYLVMNLPASSELDRDLKALCNFWFVVHSKGKALGHHLNWNEYAEEPRTPQTDYWHWDDIPDDHDLREVYDYLHEQKLAHLRGETEASNQRLSPKEVQQKIKIAKQEASTDTRDQLLQEVYTNTELSQRELGEAVGLSRSRIGQILRET